METPHEQDVGLPKRIYGILKKFSEDGLKESNEIPDDTHEQGLHIITHLFSALRTCLKQCNYEASTKIMKYLVENRQCSKQFIWKMLNTFIQKDVSFFTPMSTEITNMFGNIKGIHHDEIRLVNTIYFLNREMYDKAYSEASKFNGKGLSTVENDDVSSDTAVAASALLASYKTTLEYQLVEKDDKEAMSVMMNSFQLLISKKAYLPLIADAYTFILSKLSLQEEAEEFLLKYVDSQSGNMGISAAFHALNIAKLHLPKASLNLTLHLLETIADRSPGHPKVLELCRQYLFMQNSRNRQHSDTESNLDFESDNASVISHSKGNQANLHRSLQLIIYYMDTYVNQENSNVVRQGWSVFADIARRICLKGSAECAESIVKLYHRDRNGWWPYFQRQPAVPIPPGDAEMVSNQGVVCYVFESERHPFVANLMKMKETTLLKSLVKQLRPSKIKFDSLMQDALKANKPSEPVLLKTLSAEPPPPPLQPSITSIAQETPSLSRFQLIDSEKMAQDFEKFVSKSRPIRARDQYRTSANVRASTADILKLPIEELIAGRYRKRKNILPQTSSRMSECFSINSSLSAGSWCSSKSDSTEDTVNDSMIHGEMSRPSNHWAGRLRSNFGDDNESFVSSVSTAAAETAGKLAKPVQHTETEIMKMERWKMFLHQGRWNGSFGMPDQSYEELSSSEEYIPKRQKEMEDDGSCSEGESSFTTQSELSLGAEERSIRANYPASIPSSYPSLSPASSVSSIFTPRLSPLKNQPSCPGEVIKNEERYPFFDFDGFDTGMSVCSSTTEDIAHTIDQVLRKLECDDSITGHPSASDRNQGVTGMEDYVVVEEEEEENVAAMPDETLVPAIDHQRNVVAETLLPATGSQSGCLDVEADIHLANQTITSTSAPNRSFSRDFDASSPDMFVSLSEDEDGAGNGAVAETEIKVTDDQSPKEDQENAENSIAKLCSDIVKSALRKSISIHSPSVANTPSAVKDKPKRKSKTSSIRKKKQRRSSELVGWNVELVDRVLEEASLKESVGLATKVSTESSRVSHDVMSMTNTKTMASGVSGSDVKRQSSQVHSTPRKCHTRRKDPRYWSDSEDDSSFAGCQTPNPSTQATSSRPENKRISSVTARRQLPSTQRSPTRLQPVVDQRQPPGSDSETESADRLIEKILAEAKVRSSSTTTPTFKTPNSDNQTKKKKKRNSRKVSGGSSSLVSSLLSDTISEEKPIDVSQSIEDLMKKYLGSDESDANGSDKDTEPKSKEQRLSKGDGRSKGKIADKKKPARRSMLDQIQMDLVDRLLEEKGEPLSQPTVDADAKSLKRRRSSLIQDKSGSSKKSKKTTNAQN